MKWTLEELTQSETARRIQPCSVTNWKARTAHLLFGQVSRTSVRGEDIRVAF